MYKNPGSRLITFFVRVSLSRRGWDGFCSSESVSASGSPIFDLWLIRRFLSFPALILASNFYHVRGGLSDYGGDVSQYMDLLKGSSAFSFKPGAEEGLNFSNMLFSVEKKHKLQNMTQTFRTVVLLSQTKSNSFRCLLSTIKGMLRVDGGCLMPAWH